MEQSHVAFSLPYRQGCDIHGDIEKISTMMGNVIAEVQRRYIEAQLSSEQSKILSSELRVTAVCAAPDGLVWKRHLGMSLY